MLRRLLLLCLCVPLFVHAQEDDFRDEAVIRVGLDHSPTVDEIYSSQAIRDQVEKQADEMIAASQRRIARAQKRVDDQQAALGSAPDTGNTLAPLFSEVEQRIRTGYEVLDRANILKDIVQTARREASRRGGKGSAMVKYGGNQKFSPADLQIITKAFEARFHKPLPISAEGETSLHAALGFDHRGRVDVALSPDQTEGLWLCNYLRSMQIPYYAFRKAVPGSATGAHIHIGPGSVRMHG